MTKINIKLTIYSNDHRVLDVITKAMVVAIKNANLNVAGPIPIPNRNIRFALRRAPNIYKISFERFEMKEHKRIIIIEQIENSSKLHFLGKMVIPNNVSIKMSVLNKKASV